MDTPPTTTALSSVDPDVTKSATGAPAPASAATSTGPAPDPGAYFKVYEDYAKTLRTWLVAYGIGGPVLFITNKDVADKLSSSHAAPCIAELFLAGVALQVFLAMLNKTVMWAVYWAELYPEEAKKCRFRFAYWISSQYAIDFLIDLATLALFGAATWGAFRVLVGGV